MALKTNQMQTDLKKYREGWDWIFGKKEKSTTIKINGKLIDNLEKFIQERKAGIFNASIAGKQLREAMIKLANTGDKNEK